MSGPQGEFPVFVLSSETGSLCTHVGCHEDEAVGVYHG